jgi:Uma2 family endonuclease
LFFLIERPLPDNLHSETQGRLIIIVGQSEETRPFHVRPELRLRVAANRIRIPDVSIYAGSKPQHRVPSGPALAAIEILSPDDRYSDLIEKFNEYNTWGVRHLWMVDRSGARCASTEMEYDVRIEPAQILG